MDEYWYAICEAIFKGTEGEEWEWCYHEYVAMHKKVNTRKPGNNHGVVSDNL